MSKENLIRELSGSSLFAECPKCGQEFKLRDALLFDGLKTFPEEALLIQQQLQEELVKRMDNLKKRGVRADEGSERQAVATGLGKILEKVVPTHRDFNVPLSDCRPLYEPIDLIAFNGLSKGTIKSITFYEIKTGKARLNQHEKMVMKAIDEGKVDYKVIR